MPRFDSFDDLNVRLEEQCLKRQDEVLRGHSETIGERLMRDLDALMALPPVPYDACEKVVSVRCAPPNGADFDGLVSTIDSGHLGALYGCEAEEAALAG